MKFRDCNDAVRVSLLADALAPLPDNWLPELRFRFAAYPPQLIAACGDDFERFDVAACKAEMIRRHLRVGRGFSRVREAA